MAHLDPELLSAYIDHELPAADMAAVEEHIASCDACRAEWEELQGLSTLVRGLPVYAPKLEIDVSTLSPVNSGTLAKIVAFSKPLAIAAVVVLVAFAGLRLLTHDDTSDSGGQISFSALEPTEAGTESDREASEEEAADVPAAAPSGDDALGEAPAAESTEPALDAMPAMRAETSLATEVAAPEPSVAPTAAPAGDGETDSWLPEAIVAAVAVAVAGAAGWYRFVRLPARRRT